jgi:DNA-binding transcriptional regulator YdaS (Cro superfamily)
MSEPDLSPVDKVIKHFGGQSKAAEALGLPPANVGMWKLRGRVPADKVLAVEAATGISRHELRADIFGDAEARA